MTYHTEKLLSFHIIEPFNNKNFITWTYPSIADDQKKLIIDSFSHHNKYICLRKQKTWFYIQEDSSNDFAIVVLSKEFEPNKYKLLCDILRKKYFNDRNPVELVKLYLDLYISGSCALQENTFKSFNSTSNIKNFIQAFDLEIILFYTAILLKRRVVVYSPNLEQLQRDLLAIIALVPCRNYEDYLQPFIETPQRLKGLSFFVAGTTNPDLVKEEHLYDLFVDVQTKEFIISPKSEEILAMTKIHKDIATFLVKLSTSDLGEAKIKCQIAEKTEDLLGLIRGIAATNTQHNGKMISMTDLKSKNYHPAVESFLFNLALAESLMML